ETSVNQSPLSISISSTPTVESTQSDSISSAQSNSISSAKIQSSSQERAPDEIQQRLPLQALTLNTNRPQTPVAVLNKNGSVQKPLGRKPDSKNKPKNANL
ncbi:unnamed protein product, partial [Brachionus calyciflorus]